MGALAALLLVAFLVAEIVRPRRRRVLLGLAVAAAAVTLLEFFTGAAAAVKVDGETIVATEATLWPAYLGLALAGFLVVAAVRRLIQPSEQRLPLPPFRRETREAVV